METQVIDALLGRVIDSRYRIDARLARGGMATVYEALDLRLDRVVAVKVMHPTLAEDPGFVSRFEREAKSAARLSHPNVVSVFDQGVDGDIVFLAMEFVPGRTVRDVLRENRTLSTAQALAILEPVLEALEAAHRAGFVHRDIKPENVLISDDGRVKVADFGLARTISVGPATVSAATQGILIGTVAYLSPEQVQRGVADARSDVYGAGILLYEMLTGSVPHAGETPLAVAYQHVNADVPVPSILRPELPPEVDALVGDATRRDPDERFASAADFLVAVRAARASLPRPTPLRGHDTAVLPVEPVPAPLAPPTLPATTTAATTTAATTPRRPRRWKGPVAALLVLALALGGGWAAWWFGSARYVPVPGIINLSESAATAKLKASDLTLTVASRQFSENVRSGLIMSSIPEATADARQGSAVAVVVSKGPERYEVPSVAGETVQAATALLADRTLKVGGQRKVYDESIEAGLVVATDPREGMALRRSTEVTLLVSKGPRPITIPKLIGDDGAKATTELQDLGLQVTTSEEYSTTIDIGNIVSITPQSGLELQRGDTVALVISKGPPPVTIPSVIDLDRETAISRLEQAGLTVTVEEPLGVTPLNRVVKQTPEAGTVQPAGSRVTIQVV